MWWHEGMDTTAWIVMVLLMVALWSLVIVAVTRLYRGNGCRDSDRPCAKGTGRLDHGTEDSQLRSGAGSQVNSQSSRYPTPAP